MPNRTIIKASLRPVIGERFQPTGFPDLGPAEYTSNTGTRSLLVESPQSMANRLEEVIWDRAQEDLISPLQGMPYVRLRHPQHGMISSITEAHRLASPYLLPHLKNQLVKELDWDQKRRLGLHEVAPFLLRHDPNCLIHGVFFTLLNPGTIRLPRMLSAFIEASDVSPVISGGVKLDHLEPQGKASLGKGNVPFERREYLSPEIVAAFSLDLVQLERYNLSDEAQSFLKDLAMYKIRLFLDKGLRLRSACDFMIDRPLQLEPNDLQLLDGDRLAQDVAQGIAKLQKSGEFAKPAIWELKP